MNGSGSQLARTEKHSSWLERAVIVGCIYSLAAPSLSPILLDVDSTKTTFFLPNSLRARLKALAAKQNKPVTDLLIQGAELILDRYENQADLEELRQRAAKAREKLRRGLYAGPSVADSADAILYARERPRTKRMKKR